MNVSVYSGAIRNCCVRLQCVCNQRVCHKLPKIAARHGVSWGQDRLWVTAITEAVTENE